jgi:murein DD-endopeptidase MepM/ murein hydrolase activator NlpD
MDSTLTHMRRWRGNAYSVDMVQINRAGFRARGVMPAAPESYLIFGTPVMAPCAGIIVRSVDGLADTQVPHYDNANMAGNHVFIKCLDAHIVIANLKRGSVVVRMGDTVSVGDAVGQVGNSGASRVPHLHIHAQRPGTESAPFDGVPVPMRIEGRFLHRGERVRGYIAHVAVKWRRPF